MDSTQSPSAKPRFWLSSQELTAWARPRACYLEGRLESSPGTSLDLIRTDPASPTGAFVILVPRFAGDVLDPRPEQPTVVNVYAAPEGAKDAGSVSSEQLTLVGVGEVYASESEAAANDIRAKAARGA